MPDDKVPAWCTDEEVQRNLTEFLASWKPKLETVVGPEDAAVFDRELDLLLSMVRANTRHKAETRYWTLRHAHERFVQEVIPTT